MTGNLTVKKRNGRLEPLYMDKVNKCAERACEGLGDVSPSEIVLDAQVQLYNKIPTREIDKALIFSARSKIEKEPNYAFVAARILANTIYKEVFGEGVDKDGFELQYRKAFIVNMKKLVKAERIDSRLLEFDMKRLADALIVENDLRFKYLGLQTLYDRYFIHINGNRMETPQAFWMRVAMGLSLEEEDKNASAIEFYNLLSNFKYCPSTPTLFNSGTLHPQLSSCYLTTVDDSIDGIFGTIHGQARLSKHAGGLGVDWTPVRGTASYIKGTNGESQGLIPWLKIFNDTLVAVNQCFSPDTRVFTGDGAKAIEDIRVGDMVLTSKGEYRKVIDVMEYLQFDPMVEIDVKHSIEPTRVTAGHPVKAVRGAKKNSSNSRTFSGLQSGKYVIDWIDAGNIREGDYVAQSIPTEVVFNHEISKEDCYFYGIMLGDGHICSNEYECGVALNTTTKSHIVTWVRRELTRRGIHFWENTTGDGIQIKWSNNGFFIDHEDLYGSNDEKCFSKRFRHLPLEFTSEILRGLVSTDGSISRGKEIVFYNTSLPLIEDVRYQLLRFGVPTAGNIRDRDFDHEFTRSNGSTGTMCCRSISCDLRIPAVTEIAHIFGVEPITKKNWIRFDNFILSRVKSVKSIEPCEKVFDLKVEGMEEYATTSFLAHNGGKRKGAGAAYLETWHIDIEDFLELRKNTGDERRRTHDMNTANWIPDLFMKQVQVDGEWYLFSPYDTPDLHEIYGEAFEKRYWEYVEAAKNGEIENHRVVSAKALWKKMLTSLFETGHPWMTFKDPSNVRYSNQHVGTVHNSNLCTEILLHTVATKYKDGLPEKVGETAVCNLGSLNLIELARQASTDGVVDMEKFYTLLRQSTRVAIRILDNVIDENFYPTEEARNANMNNRPVGLGIMGFHDLLNQLGVPYESKEAVELSGDIHENISYEAILTSSLLAEAKGTYVNYKGSLWDQGVFPIDTYKMLMESRGVKPNTKTKLDWKPVRQSVAKHGMRNSNTMAIAPTATISYIHGCSQSIEPNYSMLYVYSTLSGEFTMANEFFVSKMKSLGLWCPELIKALKLVDGDVTALNLPDEIKHEFKGCFKIDQSTLIDCAAERQKWIDMGQSLNLYNDTTSLKTLNDMYMYAWEKGLKTTYYLRAKSASKIEKSTVEAAKNNAPDDQSGPSQEEIQACSIEAARNGEICEACQ